MNIRSLSQLPTVISPTKVAEASSAIKPHDTAERDADGRQPFGEKKRPVTPEELEKIIEGLKAHPGVIANNLVVELIEEEHQKVLYLKTAEGQLVRRVVEADFFDLLTSLDQSSGRIFNKAV